MLHRARILNHGNAVLSTAILICALSMLLAACAPTPAPPTLTPTSTPVPSETPTPSPTLTPPPTPTATPIPPIILTIQWPELGVSALQPVPVEISLVPPPGIDVTATVSATVLDPSGEAYANFDLKPQGLRYISEESLLLPLLPLTGTWQVRAFVDAALVGGLADAPRDRPRIAGNRAQRFEPDPIPFHNLTEVLPPGASLLVPQAFRELVSQGDLVAGGRVWRYGEGELSLWWAPGPAEPLLLNNAVVMLETTHDANMPPEVLAVEETVWQDQPAFLFHEEWPAWPGTPVLAWVIQGLDHWLYVLRVRAVGAETIPPLIHQVAETFTVYPSR